MDRGSDIVGSYEAFTSGDERVVGEEEEDYEEEEVEIEEVADDEPMHITGRLFIGSIDAARNVDALKRLRIGGALALLGQGEEDAAVSSHSSAVEGAYVEMKVDRQMVQMEDSKHGDLLRRLPGILAKLKKLEEKAERDGTNVLVHWCVQCWVGQGATLLHVDKVAAASGTGDADGIAGRSRSASVLAAWMLVHEPKQQSVQDAVDRIRIIRPWIEINPHFMRDLHLFHAVLNSSSKTPVGSETAALLKERAFPRLDFGAGLVNGILKGSKTITMRLLSDVEGDANSDLGGIFPYSLVAATTSSSDGSSTRSQFAFLRVDQLETCELGAINYATLLKSGFNSIDEVLAVLKQLYPNVTTSTPLLMLHFRCLSATSKIKNVAICVHN